MNQNVERFYQRKWGVFNHFLNRIQNNSQTENSQGKETDWDVCVKDLDVNKIAMNLHNMGAKHYFITIMQGTKHMIAPNQTFDTIAGTKPGEACSTRDLIEDLYQALSQYDIDLYLYYTGDGPYADVAIGKKFGFIEPRDQAMNEAFVKNWAAVLEEYSVRYGDKVKGWWIDGCYKEYFGYTDEWLSYYYKACKKGNPNALVAFNNGIGEEDILVNYPEEDYTCGERIDFEFIPKRRFYGKAQAHLLAPLGTGERGIGPGWCSTGLRHDKEFMADYVQKVHEAGGVMTFDIALYRDGSFEQMQMEALKYVGNSLGR